MQRNGEKRPEQRWKFMVICFYTSLLLFSHLLLAWCSFFFFSHVINVSLKRYELHITCLRWCRRKIEIYSAYQHTIHVDFGRCFCFLAPILWNASAAFWIRKRDTRKREEEKKKKKERTHANFVRATHFALVGVSTSILLKHKPTLESTCSSMVWLSSQAHTFHIESHWFVPAGRHSIKKIENNTLRKKKTFLTGIPIGQTMNPSDLYIVSLWLIHHFWKHGI